MKNISFKKKTYLSFGFIIALVAISVAISLLSLNELTTEYDHTIQGEMKTKDILRELSVGMLMSRRHEKDYLLRKKEKYIKKHHTETTNMIKALDQNKEGIVEISSITSFKKARQAILNYRDGFEKVIKGYKDEGNSKTGLRGEMRSTAHNLEKLIKEESNKDKLSVHFLTLRRREKDYLLRRDNKYLEKAKKDAIAFESSFSDSPNKSKMKVELTSYIALFEKVTLNYEAIANTINSFRKDIHTFEEIDKEDIGLINKDIVKRINTLHDLKSTVALILSCLGGFILIVSISICIYFSRVSNRITLLTNRLKVSSDKTNGSSENVKRAASDVSSSTHQQASAIQETVSSLDEIKSMVEKSVSNATESTNRAENSVQIADQGKGKVGEMITAIGDIKDTNQEIITQMDQNNKQLETIVNIIKEISNKTSVINDIVFQTKLLSFNASVEAARAGDHGKGFAVVAEEVGNLANMSGTASKEIEDMLSESITKVNSIFQDTKSSVEKLVKEADLKTEQGVRVANECNTTLEDIVDGASVVKSMLNEINEAQREQSAGVSNIAEAMNELDQTTHQNAASANETSGFSNELAIQAQELQDIVNSLENEITGSVNLTKTSSLSTNKLKDIDDEISKVTKIDSKKPEKSKKKNKKSSSEVTMTVQAKSISQEIPTANDPRFEEI